jgi:hypothetical protein
MLSWVEYGWIFLGYLLGLLTVFLYNLVKYLKSEKYRHDVWKRS